MAEKQNREGVPLQVYVPLEMRRELQALADGQDRPLARVVRQLLADGLAAQAQAQARQQGQRKNKS